MRNGEIDEIDEKVMVPKVDGKELREKVTETKRK